MTPQGRMSPLSAFFIGLFGVGAVSIAGATSIVLYTMRVIDKRTNSVFEIVNSTVENLPDLIERFPKALGELMQDRRALDYASNIKVNGTFVINERNDSARPSLVIKNDGPEVVSLMTVRVVALNAQKQAVANWTETVATPIGLDDDWLGPLAPGATRYVVLPGNHRLDKEDVALVTPNFEISELRVLSSKATQSE